MSGGGFHLFAALGKGVEAAPAGVGVGELSGGTGSWRAHPKASVKANAVVAR
jgi:hypothetical protein